VSAASSCLVAIRPGGSRPPLFCGHPAGGNVLCFVALARELGPEQPFYGLQSPGLEGDQEPYTRIEEMAIHYLKQLRALEPRGPYRLAVWSFGGLVAYEMAQQLRAAGEEVALLALLDTGVPGAGADPDAATFEDDAPWLADVGEFIARLAGEESPVSCDELKDLAPEGRIEFFVERMRESDLLPPGTSASQVRSLLRVYKANVRAAGHYSPRPYPGPIALFRAGGDPGAAAESAKDPTLGWSALSPMPVEVHTVPGDHVTLLAEPNVAVLAERLRECLDRARDRIVLGAPASSRLVGEA